MRHKKEHKLGMREARLGVCLLGHVQQDAEQVTHIVVAVKVQRKHAAARLQCKTRSCAEVCRQTSKSVLAKRTWLTVSRMDT